MMEAGRELDRLVAEEVMGYAMTAVASSDGESLGLDFDTEDWQVLPCYSTSIEAAWLVVERNPECFSLEKGLYGWEAYFLGGSTAYAYTAPLAICMAALAAVGVESR